VFFGVVLFLHHIWSITKNIARDAMMTNNVSLTITPIKTISQNQKNHIYEKTIHQP
jgi:hypothetical protein